MREKGRTKKKLKNLLNYKKPEAWFLTAAVILTVILSVGLVIRVKEFSKLSHAHKSFAGMVNKTESTSLPDSIDEEVYSQADENTDIVYTEEEIQAAMDCIRNYFNEEAVTRTLNDLWFDEEACTDIRASYMQSGKGRTNGVSEENVIVLLCNFTIENADTFAGYYPNWHIILIRDSVDGSWRIDGQGV